MSFTVEWSKEAEDELARIWLNAADRQAVTDAARKIDAVLRVRPASSGESRDPGQRVVFELPLAVLYELSDKRLVKVLVVWACRKKQR
jgi:hypothetical protein